MKKLLVKVSLQSQIVLGIQYQGVENFTAIVWQLTEGIPRWSPKNGFSSNGKLLALTERVT